MSLLLGRRSLLASATALSAAPIIGAEAQARRRIRLTAVFSDQDIRAEALRGFQRDLAAEFIRLKRMEWVEYQRHVSAWEVERYLEFF